MFVNRRARPYQLECIEAAVGAVLAGKESGLIVLPTGVGKTFTALEFLRLMRLPTLFMVHRDELVGQTVASLRRCWLTARVGVIKAERDEWRGRDVVVASVQSLTVKRLKNIPEDTFGILVTDEAHHVPAPTWDRAFRHFGAAFKLGLTATPDRLDGRGLSEWFGHEPLYAYQLAHAVRDGWLCRVRQYAVTTDVDLSGVETRAGDFAKDQLARAVNDPARNAAAADAYREHCDGRRGVAFCVDVQHAYDLAMAFCEAGIASAVVDGSMDQEDRRGTLRRFREGRIRVLANCEVLTEGFDDPEVSAVVMARPTKSRALYQQCVGRGLRLADGKDDCVILDVTDNCRNHKLVTATRLFGVNKDDAAGADVLEEKDKQDRATRRNDEHIREDISKPITWRLESVCPWPGLPSLDGYAPSQRWHNDPASEKQTAMIRKLGLSVHLDLTKGQASWLIDQAMAFEELYPAPATEKQEYRLRLEGLWEEGLTKKQASAIIARLMAGKPQE
jgi:superfamily II DNA or RNA helicase